MANNYYCINCKRCNTKRKQYVSQKAVDSNEKGDLSGLDLTDTSKQWLVPYVEKYRVDFCVAD